MEPVRIDVSFHEANGLCSYQVVVTLPKGSNPVDFAGSEIVVAGESLSEEWKEIDGYPRRILNDPFGYSTWEEAKAAAEVVIACVKADLAAAYLEYVYDHAEERGDKPSGWHEYVRLPMGDKDEHQD